MGEEGFARDGRPTRLLNPPLPASNNEYITVFAHYYRGEIARMAGWRDRVDRTSNWGITLVAAMLSLGFSTPNAHHGVILFAMVLLLFVLTIEARRYRFFDVYRHRIRTMERNYFAVMFSPALNPGRNWSHELGEDLRKPTFHISQQQAMSRRLRRNYVWIFAMLLVAWGLKVSSGASQALHAAGADALTVFSWYAGANIGFIPGWLVIAGVALFYAWLIYIAFLRYRGREGSDDGAVHM